MRRRNSNESQPRVKVDDCFCIIERVFGFVVSRPQHREESDRLRLTAPLRTGSALEGTHHCECLREVAAGAAALQRRESSERWSSKDPTCVECMAEIMTRSDPSGHTRSDFPEMFAVRHIACMLYSLRLATSVTGNTMAVAHTPKQNQLLAALPPSDYVRLKPHLQLITLSLGQVINESGSPQHEVYFPTTSIVSLLYMLANGASAEIAVVGNEGIVGVSLFMGGETTPNRAVVQSAGHGYQLASKSLKLEFTRGGAMQHLLLRYTQALLTQMAQTAVCNRHHSLDQQLCRWLLLSLDRLPSNLLVMTQQLIANMLGVRREGVTEAAKKLQSAGLIKYVRGRITVLSRRGLEQRTCECYAVVKKECDRLLPAPAPATLRKR
jgi:CRP-like cAMP-binding protein